MRWKLLLVTSLLATLVGAGAGLFFGRVLAGPAAPDGFGPYAPLVALLLPLVSITSASIFVYRHTARRRPLQAMATALLAALLTLGAMTAGSIYLARRTRTHAPAPPPNRYVG